jgi:hypothetical protein
VLQDLILTFQQIFVGAVVTATSGAVVVIGGGVCKYLTRFVPKAAPKPSPAPPDVIEPETVGRVLVVLITSKSQGRELLPDADNQEPVRSSDR